ncbi:MAG TPA: TRZ/ATZ family hydrolase [Dokdonella sp.]|uniref:TRZ/ATZ family hydrolase n=1 Tax=Dokdonella sp. TaxID=2291710 RepID=UPI002D7F318D|nr:TRZ/ATZ family hydrolase [Dokdonella sp.]HET9032270.1 TRZ/ATZ family hydrolase [Dokdonella sp.]
MTTSTPVDLQIEARWVIPIEPQGTVLESHAVVVDADRIVAILPIAEARQQFEPRERAELGEHALIPGLVNGHTHNPMTLMRGLADDVPFMVWLKDHVWPAEARVMGPEFVRDGVELAIAEMIRGGTTCCNENYFFPDVQAATYAKFGFRSLIGLPVIEFPTAWAQSRDEYFDKALAVHDELRGKALLGTAFAPHAPYTVSNESFERIHLLSDQLDLPVHLHLHETADEINVSLRDFGMRPLARLKQIGLVNERLIAVHMTQLTEAEINDCAASGVSIVHNVESNMKLLSGFCPAEAIRRAGINLAIGTDGCASNNDLDLFGEMRSAALVGKLIADDAAAMSAENVLRAATMGSARALGWQDQIGSIQVGKQADLAAVNLGTIESQPIYNVVSQLIYAAGRHQVSDVWIAGQRKLRDRELIGMDKVEILTKARRWRDRIATA